MYINILCSTYVVCDDYETSLSIYRLKTHFTQINVLNVTIVTSDNCNCKTVNQTYKTNFFMYVYLRSSC